MAFETISLGLGSAVSVTGNAVEWFSDLTMRAKSCELGSRLFLSPVRVAARADSSIKVKLDTDAIVRPLSYGARVSPPAP